MSDTPKVTVFCGLCEEQMKDIQTLNEELYCLGKNGPEGIDTFGPCGMCAVCKFAEKYKLRLAFE